MIQAKGGNMCVNCPGCREEIEVIEKVNFCRCCGIKLASEVKQKALAADLAEEVRDLSHDIIKTWMMMIVIFISVIWGGIHFAPADQKLETWILGAAILLAVVFGIYRPYRDDVKRRREIKARLLSN